MHDIPAARDLILAEWRSCHPCFSDNLGIDLPVFIEGILASPDLPAFPPDCDRRRLIRDWVVALEEDRRRERARQHAMSAA